MTDTPTPRPPADPPPLARPDWLTVLASPGGELLGAAIDPGVPFERWAAYATAMLRFCRGLQWVVGDLLRGGEALYGEAYAQVLDAADYDSETLRACQWVAGRFDPVRRRTALPWSHHREVASLGPASADALLDRAASEGLSSRDLRRLVSESKRPPAPRQQAAPTDGVTTMTFDEFVSLAEKMRAAQKRYFDRRDNLDDAKALERQMDQAINHYRQPRGLFDPPWHEEGPRS